MRRLTYLVTAALAAVVVIACRDSAPGKPSLDILISGGIVYAGDGDIGILRDIGIVDDRIVAVGPGLDEQYIAAKTIDAAGLTVTPGFIDPHTHALGDLATRSRPDDLPNYLFQGVTTVVIGNDGHGSPKVDELRRRAEHVGIGPNMATFVGHNALRSKVIGLDDRAPLPQELERMQAYVREAMEAGALGLSAGLYYTPGSYAETAELVALAGVAAEYGGLYDSHLRDESSYSIGLLGAVDEALEIGRQSGARVHIAHIKALGVDVWGQSEAVIRRVEQARAAGQVVTADQYPWQASGTRLTNALLPGWVKDGGEAAMRSRLTDPSLRDRIHGEIAENLRRRGGGDAILIVSGSAAGKKLSEAAQADGRPQIETAIALILDGDARIASFNMREEDIERFMTQDWVVTSSDGTDGHPRKFASFPRKYQTYVAERGVLSIAEFIERSTARTADILRLCDRGRLEVGAAADVLVLDLEEFRPRADFTNPEVLSTGVIHLIVNGEAVIEDARLTGRTPGRALARGECEHATP